ncbi:MAG: aminotransferase class V-fold PLP-dependent enzyme [Acidobacteriota bacterium]
MSDPLLEHRSSFPILESTNYLISNSLGAMPDRTRDRLAEYGETWATRGVRAWAESWWVLPRTLGDLVASLFGAGENEVSIHQNVTLATAGVLSAFDWQSERNGVVVTDMNFPSLLYLYERHQEQGLRLQQVRTEDGVSIDTQAMIDAIDETTRLVALDHVLFRSAYIQDAKAIAEAAHAKGALVLLDAYQSVGTLEVDVQDLGVDFLTGGVLKWLCGGPGASFLWVRPELAQTLNPRLTGWMAHPDPFDFDPGDMRYRDDAFRFEVGTPNVPALHAAISGVEIVAEVGSRAIREKSVRQTARLVELAQERGHVVTCPMDPERRGGTVAFDVPEAKAVCQELLARDVVVDYRPQAGIRVSPHFYTKDEELVACVDQIDDILETKAYEKHLAELPKYG